MNRTIVIFHDKADMDENVNKLLEDITSYKISNKIIVFTESGDKYNKNINGITISNINWPIECNTTPKRKNWINSYLKTQSTNGFVHVLVNCIKLNRDPNQFIDELEHMMNAYDYSLWLNTTTDPCNYLYNKFNPRLILDIDNDEFKSGYGDKLIFTSHSNDNWITYNFDTINENLLKFDEDFTIPMFYIIELLARRKVLRKPNQPFYMNQYMTVSSEFNTFNIIESKTLLQNNSEQMKHEDQCFKNKNINFIPDNNIDQVLENCAEIYRSLKNKI